MGSEIRKKQNNITIYYMHNQEIPWFLPDIKLVFSLFSRKKYFLLAGEIKLFNRNYFFCNIWTTITKTRLYNFDPLKPHFYIVKLGFTGVYIIFLISVQNIDCVYLLEPPRRGSSNEYPQSIFWAEIWKISGFFIWKCSIFIVVKLSIYLNRRVFVMLDFDPAVNII